MSDPVAPADGALAGLRVVELAGLGPAPFAAMMLADHGAEVTRVDPPPERPAIGVDNPINRGRRSIRLDLKSDDGRDVLHRLLHGADVLLDPYRPGVLERLRLAPDDLLARHPALIVARMSGWGQDGPMRTDAGHDVNFIGVSGLLDTIGTEDSGPVVPLMYAGDFAGGGMTMAFGILAAVIERGRSGRGQVIDASILEGSSLLTVSVRGLAARGDWWPERGTNSLDSGSHYYGTYRTADDQYMAVGAIEPQFYLRFLAGLGLGPNELPDQHDRQRWPEAKRRIAEVFARRTRAEWEEVFAGLDACVTPVLSLAESAEHPQLRARGGMVDVGGTPSPAPVPRFSRSAPPAPSPPPQPGEHTEQILRELG